MLKFISMIKRLIPVFLFILLSISPSWALEVALRPEVLRQGDVFLIRIKPSLYPEKGGTGGFSYKNLQGIFMDKKIHFFKTESGDYMALAGIDMKTAPGEYTLSISNDNKKVLEKDIKILSASFGVQSLTLPKEKVDLTSEILKRVKIEQAKIAALLPVINERLWKGRFIMPVNGNITGPFGVRRIINKEEKSPHSGIDIKADEGTPISAPNNGRIALIDDQFFGGKTIVIDHGYGIYSILHHLSKITVSDGQLVNRGEIIGHVGSTGRATGPNLHWGVRLQGERINPISLINLEID